MKHFKIQIWRTQDPSNRKRTNIIIRGHPALSDWGNWERLHLTSIIGLLEQASKQVVIKNNEYLRPEAAKLIAWARSEEPFDPR